MGDKSRQGMRGRQILGLLNTQENHNSQSPTTDTDNDAITDLLNEHELIQPTPPSPATPTNLDSKVEESKENKSTQHIHCSAATTADLKESFLDNPESTNEPIQISLSPAEVTAPRVSLATEPPMSFNTQENNNSQSPTTDPDNDAITDLLNERELIQPTPLSPATSTNLDLHSEVEESKENKSTRHIHCSAATTADLKVSLAVDPESTNEPFQISLSPAEAAAPRVSLATESPMSSNIYNTNKDTLTSYNSPSWSVVQGSASNLVFCRSSEGTTKITYSIKRKPENDEEVSIFNDSANEESDADISDSDPTYAVPKRKKKIDLLGKKIVIPPSSSSSSSSSASSSSSSSESSSSSDSEVEPEGTKTKKRIPHPEKWKKNVAKALRNSGKTYCSEFTKKKNGDRNMKPPCTEKCRLKCSLNIDEDNRSAIFREYWKMGDINMQRAFLSLSMVEICPKYKYSNTETPRNLNKAFYFTAKGKKIRVCKTFFLNTLDISDRMLRTVVKKTNHESGMVARDMRGKHENRKTLDPELVKNIKDHINSIPRIESHYMRANTTREFIEGSKTVAELYRDFKEEQEKKGREIGTYDIYLKIFNTQFNIGFHSPKKDQCDLCVKYKNSGDDKDLKEQYEVHIMQKDLCRQAKQTDRVNINIKSNRVVVYDLQAVLQSPKGDSSAFYYKSKLNSYNFTMTELTKLEDIDKKYRKCCYDNVHCYFWSETDANRGSNEIGSCVLKYLEEINSKSNEQLDIIFYSDNCCGQQKNKFIVTAYMYAVTKYANIRSITHKFMIKGHTENEADNVHSLIEKQIKRNLKSGPIYVPAQYVSIIKNAKKTGTKFSVYELTHDSFKDLKDLQESWGPNFTKNTSGAPVKWGDIRIIKVEKKDPTAFLYKESYDQEDYETVKVRNPRNKRCTPLREIEPILAYDQKQPLTAKKKNDLMELLNKGVIPNFYRDFFTNL